MLANVVSRLPSMGRSHFVEARRDDPEFIEALLVRMDEMDEEPTWSPRGAEWSQDTEQLTKIIDLLGVLIAIEAARGIPAGARQPTMPKPHPRPAREIDRVRVERAVRQRGDLDDEVEAAKVRYREARERGELPPEELPTTQ